MTSTWVKIDIAKEHPNVIRMKILGARVVPVTRVTKTLKGAVDDVFDAYLSDTVTSSTPSARWGGLTPSP